MSFTSNEEAVKYNDKKKVKYSTTENHHEPERTGSLKIRKVWLLESDVMGLQVSRHRI